MRTYQIEIVGVPAPQGSKRHVGHGVLVESSKGVSLWRSEVIVQSKHIRGLRLDCPLTAYMEFRLPRPAAARKRRYVYTRPDLSKLVRSTEDALVQAGVISDDSRIVACWSEKRYVLGNQAPGATIRLTVMEE